MISSIRSSMSGKMFKYVLWGALLAIPGGTLLMGLLDRFSGPRRSGSVATVNGYTVSQIEMRDKIFDLDQQIKYARSKYGEYADFYLQMMGLSGNPVDSALSQLIDEKLILDYAEKMGITHISEEFINEKLADSFFAQQYFASLVPPSLYNQLGELDHRGLHKYLMRRGMSLSEFEAGLASSLKRISALSLLPSAVYVPQATMQRSLLQQNNNREFAVLSFDLNRYIRQARSEGVSNKEIEDFFATQNRLFKRYWVPEQRTATVWEFSANNYGIKVLEKEAKMYFYRNKKEFGDKSFKEVRKDVEQRIRKEKFRNRFTADARRYTAIAHEDSAALTKFIDKHKAQKSSISLDKKQVKTAVEHKVFELKGVGKMGSRADADKGYLVQLDSVKASYEPQLQDVRKDVEEDYFRSNAQKDLKKAIESSSQDLSTETIKDVANKWNAQVRTISVESSNSQRWSRLSKDGLPVARMKKMIHAGYAIDQVTPEGGYVVQLVTIEPLKFDVSSEMRSAEEQRLKGDEIQLFTTAFIASLQNNATIDYKNLQATR